MKANEFDIRFETGKSLLGALDREASRLGVTRQSIIKLWVAERLEEVG